LNVVRTIEKLHASHGVVLAQVLPGIALVAALFIGCAGSMPKIPNTPEAILEKADENYGKKNYYKAQELYKAFLSRHPGHDRSDYAQFKLGESYYENREYPMASVEYQILLNNYGYSEYVDDALFKLGLCYYYESPKSQRDQQKAQDALSRFNQFLQTFPNSPLVPEVKENVALIHAKLAKKAFDAGYYYYRRKKWLAATIYFNKVLENYPDNEYWARSAYFNAIIMEDRGETDDAIRYFSMVLAYPEELRYKSNARARLEKLRR
jgi:outer membrane protein assembly factor BamD